MKLTRRRLTRLSAHLALAVTALAVTVALPASSASAAGPYTISAGQLSITLDATGTVTNLVNTSTGKDYASSAHQRSLIQLVANGSQQLPTALSYNAPTSTYDFTFGAISTDVFVKATTKTGYTTFEVTSINPGSGVDVSILMWGPITTSITKTVGESVGVVYDNDFAIGIHELNNKTVGGWVNEYDNLSYRDDTYTYKMPFDWNSAARTSWGSILQAYTYDATTARTRGAGQPSTSIWMPNQPMPALIGTDAQIVGSKIALFGSATTNVLSTLSAIQTGEGLIHPTVGGQWDKTSQASSQSFLVLSDLNTSDVAQASQYANAAGINYLYALIGVNGPWAANGHFMFNSSFGGSDAGAKSIVDTAATYNVKVGVHTLSDFIDPGDAYTHPTPDPDLVTAGSATLTRALDTSGTDVYVSSDTPFRNSLGTDIQIGNEIANFATITQIGAGEWKLSGGTRAIWGTTAAAHGIGDTVHRLMGNEYGGSVGGMPIINAISARLASIFNTTGIKAMSWDGLESASQAGYGTYPTNTLVNGMYSQLNSTSDFISEASNLVPNTWDAQTRISWGEGSLDPVERYNNMAYCVRNFLPAMIGWLPVYTNSITMEAQLAKMAGWNAGAGFQTSVGTLNSMTTSDRNTLFDSIKQWETARNIGAFTPTQKTQLRDMNSYWHLAVVTPGSRWTLQQITSTGTAIGLPEDVFVGNTDPTGTPVNLALTATATASSQFDSRYLAGNAIDGVTGQSGYGEWASAGETNPWLRLDWNTAQTISKITLYDRPDTSDSSNGGTLLFSDGSTVPVTGIPGDGTPYTVTFPDRTVTWVKFQVAGGTGPNNGLSEIQVFHADRDLALTATASASSVYDSRYVAANAIDAVIGVTGSGEWASAGETNPWLRLAWTTTQTISKITLYDRPNTSDSSNGGTLTFSDGSTVPVTGIPNDGTPYTVTFPDKTVTWVKFQVTGGTGTNDGLSEIAVTHPDPGNLASTATASASSIFDSRYLAANVIDGITGHGGFGEWASAGETNPWIRLDWTSSQTISQITLYDRPNPGVWSPGGTLTFSDGSTVPVTGIPNDGTPYTVTFPDKTVTWVKFQVTGGTTTNNGLAEIEVRHPAPVNLALFATATASSIYDSRYVASNVFDGITGQVGVGEWASLGETNPWIRLDLNASLAINKITFYDRVQVGTGANAGTLSFSDGSTVPVSGIPDNGTPYTVTFPDKTVTWVKFQVTAGIGTNVGLDELQIFHQ